MLKRIFMPVVNFYCPDCNERMFDNDAKIYTLREIELTTCKKCNRAFTKTDVINQARDAATSLFLHTPRKR
ncbi:ECs_2282 family putative zinc-binding protein [Enterobacter sichuanensis]|nr:hypothetical protein [Enterobacter bugandensis]